MITFRVKKDTTVIDFLRMEDNNGYRLLQNLSYLVDDLLRIKGKQKIGVFREQCRDWILRVNREQGSRNPVWGYMAIKIAYMMIQLEQYEKEGYTQVLWDMKIDKKVKVEA